MNKRNNLVVHRDPQRLHPHAGVPAVRKKQAEPVRELPPRVLAAATGGGGTAIVSPRDPQ